MPDVHDPATRSRNMAAIKSKNTKPELLIRKALYKYGLRYRLHKIDLPGRPDIIFSKHKAVIFIHGCFWRRHQCYLFKWPKNKKQFWKIKIEGNATRDAVNYSKLNDAGWRVLIVWECALKGPHKLSTENIVQNIAGWLKKGEPSYEITGQD